MHVLGKSYSTSHLPRTQIAPTPQLTYPTRPTNNDSPVVWEAVIASLGSGDGQPLQKLALSGLGRLLAWSLPSQGRRPPNSLSRPPSPGATVAQDYVVLPDPATEMEDDEEGAKAGVGLPLAEALSTPEFCRTLCLALAHDHR